MPSAQPDARRRAPPRRAASTPTVSHVTFYKILDVDVAATADEIKKAYRKQALIWHPDKNPGNKDEAEMMFKKISEAYEVLSDDNKRAIYDRHGEAGLKRASNAPNDRNDTFRYEFRSPFEVFHEFFATDPFKAFFSNNDKSFPSFVDPFDDFFSKPVPHHGAVNRKSSKIGGVPGSLGAFINANFHSPSSNLHQSFTCDAPFIGTQTTFRFTSAPEGQQPRMRKTSTTSKMVDGKKVIINKTAEPNGGETIEVFEDGILKESTKVPVKFTISESTTRDSVKK